MRERERERETRCRRCRVSREPAPKMYTFWLVVTCFSQRPDVLASVDAAAVGDKKSFPHHLYDLLTTARATTASPNGAAVKPTSGKENVLFFLLRAVFHLFGRLRPRPRADML